MKETRKVLCIIGVGIISVLLTVSTVYACCGMYPNITQDAIVTGCTGDEVTFSGTLWAEETWDDSYSENASMSIEVTSPSGNVTVIPVDLGTAVEDPPLTATFTYSETYTTPEVGTYTYAKSASWTTSYGTEYESEAGSFDVECLSVDVDIKGGSCPNPLNPRDKENPQGKGSKGSIPVAILAAADLDLADIDLSSLELNGVPVNVNDDGTIGIMEDSTQPGDYSDDCYDCFDADDPANFNCDLDGDGVDDAYCGDGIPELVVKFDTSDVAATITGPLPKGACVVLELTGLLLDGTTSISGSDSMILVKAIAGP